MGIVMWKPNNQEDLAILEELFEAGKVKLLSKIVIR